MQEHNVTLVWWVVVTDSGEHKLTEKELDILLDADRKGARFVRFDDVIINVAFVKEAYKRTVTKNTEFYTILDEEKFIVGDTPPAISGAKILN